MASRGATRGISRRAVRAYTPIVLAMPRLLGVLLLLRLCATSALVPPPPRSALALPGARPGRRRAAAFAPTRARSRVVARAEVVEDTLALGGDVVCVVLYAYTQKILDVLFAFAANVSDGIVAADTMDAFADPAFGAAALSLAWIAVAAPQGAFRFDNTRFSSTSAALTTVLRSGGLAVLLLAVCLAARAKTFGVDLCPQDFGFAGGILPVLGAWRYVLAEATDI